MTRQDPVPPTELLLPVALGDDVGDGVERGLDEGAVVTGQRVGGEPGRVEATVRLEGGQGAHGLGGGGAGWALVADHSIRPAAGEDRR